MKRPCVLLASLVACLLQTAPFSAAHSAVKVVSSSPAVHSLVLHLVDGLDTEAALLLEPGDTAHDVNLTADKLRLLEEADVVVVVGADEPDILHHDELEELRGGYSGVVNIIGELPGRMLVFTEHCHDDDDHRDDHGHGRDDHDDHHDDHDDDHDHGHDDHDDHHEDEGHMHEDHGSEHHDEHDDNDRGLCVDSHVWLSTTNAKEILRIVADRLKGQDPANAGRYQANLEAALAQMDELEREIDRILAGASSRQIIAWHDAFAYFSRRDGFPRYLDGGMSDTHVSSLSGRRLVEMIDYLSEDGPGCVIFGAPEVLRQHSANFSAIPDTKMVSVNPIGELTYVDKQSYQELMTNVANAFATCE